MKTISQKIRGAGDLLLQALRDSGSSINERLNSTLNEFLTWPFRVNPACIVDSDGRKASFDTVIYTASGFDDYKTTFQVNGGYQFTEMWGIEVQYTSRRDSSMSISINSRRTTETVQMATPATGA